MRTILLVAGSLLPLISSAAYIGSILRGKTRPQRMTRFLMLVITAIMTLSLWAGGDTSGVWLALVSFVQALLIYVLSFRRGIGGRDNLDIACLVLCGVGIAIWLLTDQPWLALGASILADLIACVPSFIKTIRLPHTELTTFYALDTVAGVVILLAGPFTTQAMIFPLYIALINLAFVAAIRWPRKVPVTP